MLETVARVMKIVFVIEIVQFLLTYRRIPNSFSPAPHPKMFLVFYGIPLIDDKTLDTSNTIFSFIKLGYIDVFDL